MAILVLSQTFLLLSIFIRPFWSTCTFSKSLFSSFQLICLDFLVLSLLEPCDMNRLYVKHPTVPLSLVPLDAFICILNIVVFLKIYLKQILKKIPDKINGSLVYGPCQTPLSSSTIKISCGLIIYCPYKYKTGSA